MEKSRPSLQGTRPVGGAESSRTPVSAQDIKSYFSIVQYAPSEVRDERLNIALILQSPGASYAGVRVRPHMDGLLKAIWPQVDGELIRLMTRAIEEELQPLNRAIKQTGPGLFHEIADQRANPAYLERFSRGYSSVRITPPKPVLVRPGVKFKDKLEQLFDTYVGLGHERPIAQNITKDVVRLTLTRQLQRHDITFGENHVINGEFFRNKFDVVRPRLVGASDLVHTISFDTETGDQAISQCLRLIQSVADIRNASTRLREQYQYGVFLQPPVHNPKNNSDYTEAIKALRRDFVVFQNLRGMEQEAGRVAEILKSDGGLQSAS